MHKIKHVFFDFDGVFTDNRVYVFDDGREAVKCSRADGIGIELLKKAGLHVAVISSETNPVVAYRAKKLGLCCVQDCKNKIREINRIVGDFKNVAFVGNDLNDLCAMRVVGLSLAPADACREVKKTAHIVLENKGGEGAVREAAEVILNINGGMKIWDSIRLMAKWPL